MAALPRNTPITRVDLELIEERARLAAIGAERTELALPVCWRDALVDFLESGRLLRKRRANHVLVNRATTLCCARRTEPCHRAWLFARQADGVGSLNLVPSARAWRAHDVALCIALTCSTRVDTRADTS